MDNNSFIQQYLQLQKDVMFGRLDEHHSYTFCYCAADVSPFWNNVYTSSALAISQIEEVEKEMKKLHRVPAFYFEEKSELAPFKNTLLGHGYKQSANDSFMFFPDREVNDTQSFSGRKVENEKDLEVFLKTFDACYVKDDPVNPYGEIGEYIVPTRNAWNKHHAS